MVSNQWSKVIGQLPVVIRHVMRVHGSVAVSLEVVQFLLLDVLCDHCHVVVAVRTVLFVEEAQ